MGRKIAEWYINNKTKVLTAIFVIIVIILVSIIVNFLNALQLNEVQTNTETNVNVQENNTPIGNFTDIYVGDSESVVTGENMSSAQVTIIDTINQFVQLCNEGNVNEAYNMLSDECKEEVYPSLDSFSNNYYNAIFNGQKKNIAVENWVNSIYKVTFENDALSTGMYTEEGTIQDYITVTRNENNELRLNINNYIGREEINKTHTDASNVTITVLRSDTYMDYETYTYSVTNKTNNTILLDDKFSTDNMYVEDENGNQYTAYIHELSEAQLTLTPGETKEITIKYYSRYGSTKNINKVVFNKIILNYNEVAVRKTTRIEIEL